ncbi:MAG: glycosyltransferase family 9 protein [Chitinophagales bacterium]|nr:glycosyltransferase family 9 protein [Chitinophagales bacterium]
MKILLVRFSSIGDIVLTTPVIRCLKQQIPNSEIHYLTKSAYSSMLIANPYIDYVHEMKDNDLTTCIKKLKVLNLDHIVDLHHNLRTKRLKFSLGKPSTSFYKANLEKWFMVNMKIDKLPKKHIVDRYLETVEDLNVVNDKMGLDYFIPEAEKVNINSIDEDLQDYTAIVLGAKFQTKRFPIDKMSNVIRMLKGDVVLVGGNEDKADGEFLEHSRKRVFNCCGSYTINQSADIIRQSKAVISNDTGMMHIAAAFEKHLITLWGNTIPDFGMYPYFPENSLSQYKIIENHDLKCRPCSKIGFDKCPKKHFKCMVDLDETAIAALLNK